MTSMRSNDGQTLPDDHWIFEELGSPVKQQERTQCVPTSNVNSGRIEEDVFKKKLRIYAVNMRKLIITARKEIKDLRKENATLSQKLRSSGLVECPACLYHFKPESKNRILPKYVKVFRGKLSVEIEFSSLDEISEWLTLNQLDENSDGLPTMIQIGEQKPDLFTTGSLLHQLVKEEETKRERVVISTRPRLPHFAPGRDTPPANRPQSKEPLRSMKRKRCDEQGPGSSSQENSGIEQNCGPCVPKASSSSSEVNQRIDRSQMEHSHPSSVLPGASRDPSDSGKAEHPVTKENVIIKRLDDSKNEDVDLKGRSRSEAKSGTNDVQEKSRDEKLVHCSRKEEPRRVSKKQTVSNSPSLPQRPLCEKGVLKQRMKSARIEDSGDLEKREHSASKDRPPKHIDTPRPSREISGKENIRHPRDLEEDRRRVLKDKECRRGKDVDPGRNERRGGPSPVTSKTVTGRRRRISGGSHHSTHWSHDSSRKGRDSATRRSPLSPKNHGRPHHLERECESSRRSTERVSKKETARRCVESEGGRRALACKEHRERSPQRGERKPPAPARCSISPRPERSASPQLQFDDDGEADELISCDEVVGEDEYEVEEGEISD